MMSKREFYSSEEHFNTEESYDEYKKRVKPKKMFNMMGKTKRKSFLDEPIGKMKK